MNAMNDPEVNAELPPKPPGRAVVDYVNDDAPELPADFLATGERLTFALAAAPGPPSLPAAWQPLADWSSQPSPAFGGAANTIHFYLNHTDGIGYQGCMFFKPASPPYHYFSRNRFYGTGHVYPSVPWGELYKTSGPAGMPAPWVRLIIAIRATGGLAGLTFHEAGGSGALPATQVGWAEEDVGDLLGRPPHFVTGFGPWILYLELTSLLL
jgi:hypothetical protein